MRAFSVLSVLGALLAPLPALADPILLFGTGVDGSGAPLAPGSIDPHYTASTIVPGLTTSTYLGAYDGMNAVTDPAYVPTTAYWGGLNVISAAASGLPGTTSEQAFTYRTRFDLTGFLLSTVTIDLQYYFDDQGEIALNGVLQPSSFTNGFTTTSITGGFIEGVNTLDFVTFNQGGPGGIYVGVLNASATVPEPASLALLGLSLLALPLLRRLRSRDAQAA